MLSDSLATAFGAKMAVNQNAVRSAIEGFRINARQLAGFGVSGHVFLLTRPFPPTEYRAVITMHETGDSCSAADLIGVRVSLLPVFAGFSGLFVAAHAMGCALAVTWNDVTARRPRNYFETAGMLLVLRWLLD